MTAPEPVPAKTWNGTNAYLSGDGLTVTHRSGTWSQRFPADLLPEQIAFYRALRDREGGKYARHYRDDVAALEALQAQIEARGKA